MGPYDEENYSLPQSNPRGATTSSATTSTTATTTNTSDSNYNSIFIVPNLHLKTDSRRTKQKAESYNHKPETYR